MFRDKIVQFSFDSNKKKKSASREMNISFLFSIVRRRESHADHVCSADDYFPIEHEVFEGSSSSKLGEQDIRSIDGLERR